MTKVLVVPPLLVLAGLMGGANPAEAQTSRSTAPRPATTDIRVITPRQERADAEAQAQSPFARAGLFTYRPAPDQQLFALNLQPQLPPDQAHGRDVLVLLSLAATQAGEGWLASLQIVDQLLQHAGPNDRLDIWTV